MCKEPVIITTNAPSPALELAPELLHKAALLRASALFGEPTDGSVPYQKQVLFLVLAGQKPVGEAASGHWESTAAGRRTVADDPELVAAFLTELGLAYELISFDGHATDALVSLDPALLTAYHQASASNDVTTIGRLFGYPDTAIAAFVGGADALLDDAAYEQHVTDAGLDAAVIGFALSAAHWAEELAVARNWQALLVAANLT